MLLHLHMNNIAIIFYHIKTVVAKLFISFYLKEFAHRLLFDYENSWIPSNTLMDTQVSMTPRLETSFAHKILSQKQSLHNI